VTQNANSHPAADPALVAAWDASVRAGVAALRNRRYDTAEQCFLAALEEARRLGQADPRVGITYSNLAILHLQCGRPALAEESSREALHIFEATLEPRHSLRASGHHQLGFVCATKGKWIDAESHLRRAVSLFAEIDGVDPEEAALAHARLGMLLRGTGDLEDAAYHMGCAVELREKNGASEPELVEALERLAEIETAAGNLRAAEGALRKAAALRHQSHGPDSPMTALSLQHLAMNLAEQQQLAEASALYARVLAVFEKSLGIAHPGLGPVYEQAAQVEASRGAFSDAERLYLRALEVARRQDDTARLLACHDGLAQVGEATGRPDQSRAHRLASIQVLEAVLGPEHPEIARRHAQMGARALKEGRVEEALTSLRCAARALDELGALASNLGVDTLRHLARALRLHGEQDEAFRMATLAYECAVEAFGEASDLAQSTARELASH
jgi:tetratricopeptide (TPR) repeat protein